MIADDCAEDREIYREYLRADPHHTYQIIEASSAEAGLGLCEQHRVDVILLDFQLPDLTGLEFLDEISRHPTTSSVIIPVIMLTGYGDEKIAVQAIKRGAQDYLGKNQLQAEGLQRAVRNAIQQAQLQTQLNQVRDRQRWVATVALRMRESSDLAKILQTTALEVQRFLHCDRVQIHPFTGKQFQDCATCLPSFSLPSAGPALPSDCFQQNDLVVPIPLSAQVDRGEMVWGWLVAHDCSMDRQWQPEETSILQELALHLSIAIQQAELLIHTQVALAKERELSIFKSKIIATVSHEYRTPLSVILAASSLLLKHREDLPADQQQRYLQFIEDKARHLTRLVDDMLILEQCELDKTRFRPMPVDLSALVSQVIEQQKQIAGESYQLSLKARGHTQVFWGDHGMLRLILINLLDNAIKYSPQGGAIEVSLRNQGDQVVFVVKDEGIGIPISEQSGLFQSFCRGTNVETIPGTGLGLAIVKACVEIHGGSIQLQSRLGRGTKVSIILPKQPLPFSSARDLRMAVTEVKPA
jgi:signal transduction histidine kinase/CheY-like chemotaxis protein